MTLVLRRVLLAILFLVAVWVGIWAYFMPRSWYDTFPGAGMRLLVQLGPYNEHFVKDVGSMYLALAVLTAVAIWLSASDAVVRVTAAAWTTFNVLHMIYHLTMLSVYDAREKIFLVVSLVVVLIVSALLLLPARRHAR